MAEPTPSPDNDAEQQYAALDLGSNSFHLLVVQQSPGRLQVLDKHKEMVRLAEGLDDNDHLDPKVAKRALACLERLGQRLRSFPADNVRVVGTNTLRRADDAADFIASAEAVLGHQIEVISGREEARLIYLGVSHALEDHATRLVVDIGGGSTELIVGRRFQPVIMESLYMGCVAMSQRFFADGDITEKAMTRAENTALQELEPIRKAYTEAEWETAIGSSGTIAATASILEALKSAPVPITLDGLNEIRQKVIDAGHVDRLKLSGLASERAPVYPGGLAILRAIFRSLGITEMNPTQGALREGLIQDLIGRASRTDTRAATIEDLISRYHTDTSHARRVRETAISLLAQVAAHWKLKDPEVALLLGWAAELHEIGFDIAHSQYHKHGGYLLQYMDMAGFSRTEQHDLALLVRAHRRKFPVDLFASDNAKPLMRLAVLLRLSVVLHRNRSNEPLPHVGIGDKKGVVQVRLPATWLAANPLTALDLSQEAAYLQAIPLELTLIEED